MTAAAAKITRQESRRAAKTLKKGPAGEASTSQVIEGVNDGGQMTTNDEETEVSGSLDMSEIKRRRDTHVIDCWNSER